MVERLFLGWSRPLLPMAAETLIDSYSGSDSADLRGAAIALPGARASRRLMQLLLEEATRRGLRLHPPRILTTGGLPELFYRPILPDAAPFLQRQGWSATLRGSTAAVQAVLGRVPEADDVLGWDACAATIMRLHGEVAAGGHHFGEVARCCESGALLFDDGERWRVLAVLQDDYQERLRRAGFSDPDLARIAALRRGQIIADLEVWVVGAPDLPGITRSLLRGAASRVVAVIHAPAAEVDTFDDVGCVDPRIWSERLISIREEEVRVVERPPDQAAAVLQSIDGLGEVEAGEVVIGVADAELVPYIEEWLEAAEVTAHYGGGMRLARSAPYRLLVGAADFLESGRWAEFAALVRHPDLETWLARRDGPGTGSSLAALDRHHHEHLPEEISDPAGVPLRPLPRHLLRHLRSPELLGRLEGRRPIHDWAEPLLAVLAEVYRGRPLAGSDPRTRRLLAGLDRLRSAAADLRGVPSELAATTDAATAVRLMLGGLAGERVPEEPDRAGVELLGWLELPLDDSPFAIVAGVNEGRLPESTSAHAFLPDSLRRSLGLFDNGRRLARDAFLMTSLLQSRASVRVIAGRWTAKGDPLRPSRLLLRERGPKLARRVVEFLGPDPRGASALSPLLAGAGTGSAFSLPPVRSLSFEPPSTVSVTDFKAYLDNPYRFVLERRLGLDAIDDTSPELDGRGFGDLAHRVLQRFGRNEAVHSSDPAEVSATLGKLLDEEVEQRYGRGCQPTVLLQAEQLRERLRRFASWQARRRAEGWVVKAVEGVMIPAGAEAPGDVALAAPFEVDGSAITLRGRVDRVDHHPATGRWAILDYKTSEAAVDPETAHRRSGTGGWKDLQLPLYRHLVGAMRDGDGIPLIPPGSPLELGYLLLPRELERVGVEIAMWSEPDLLEADEVARRVIREMRVGIAIHDPSRSRSWSGDPLAPLLGLRVLAAAEEEEREEAEVLP